MIITHNGTILKHDGTILTKITEVPPQPPFTNTYSLDFDGIDDKVDCGTIPHFTTSQNTFSVSFWFKNSSVSGNVINIGGKIYFIMGSNRIECWNLGNVNGRADTTGVVWGTTWHNLTYVFDGSGATNEDRVKVYVDGVLNSVIYQNTQPTSTTATSVSTFISASPFGAYYNGNVDEVSIFDSAINIADVWDGSGQPTDLTSLNPIAWYRNGDNGSYKSPQWLIPSNENKDKVSNYSFDFDGVDDYISISSPTFDATNGLTLSSWIKYDGVGAGLNWLFSNGGTGGTFSQFNTRMVADGRWFNYFQGGAVYTGISGLADGNWHHIAQTVNYSNGEVKFYKDGVVSSTVLAWGTTYSTVKLAQISTSFYPFKGQVDEVAVFQGLQNISDLYNGGQPTTISGAVAHYKMGEEANFTSNWLVDNSALDNYSKRSFEFDGVGDKVSFTSVDLGLNSTVSLWVKRNTTSGTQVFLGEISYNSNYIVLVQANKLYFRIGTALKLFGSASVVSVMNNTTNWINIVFVRQGDSVELFLNGVSMGTETGLGTSVTTKIDTIGDRPNGGFPSNAKFDEVALFDSAISIGDLWDGSGEPIDVSAVSGIVSNYRMGEDASFNGTNWTIPDNVGTNNGTSNAMTVDNLVGEAPNYSGGGISEGMTIEDRVGNAPNSENNALSYNMEREDRVEDTP